jgi:hypothetical protein
MMTFAVLILTLSNKAKGKQQEIFHRNSLCTKQAVVKERAYKLLADEKQKLV